MKNKKVKFMFKGIFFCTSLLFLSFSPAMAESLHFEGTSKTSPTPREILGDNDGSYTVQLIATKDGKTVRRSELVVSREQNGQINEVSRSQCLTGRGCTPLVKGKETLVAADGEVVENNSVKGDTILRGFDLATGELTWTISADNFLFQEGFGEGFSYGKFNDEEVFGIMVSDVNDSERFTGYHIYRIGDGKLLFKKEFAAPNSQIKAKILDSTIVLFNLSAATYALTTTGYDFNGKELWAFTQGSERRPFLGGYDAVSLDSSRTAIRYDADGARSTLDYRTRIVNAETGEVLEYLPSANYFTVTDQHLLLVPDEEEIQIVAHKKSDLSEEWTTLLPESVSCYEIYKFVHANDYLLGICKTGDRPIVLFSATGRGYLAQASASDWKHNQAGYGRPSFSEFFDRLIFNRAENYFYIGVEAEYGEASIYQRLKYSIK